MKFIPISILPKINPIMKSNLINTFVFGFWGVHENYLMTNYNIDSHSLLLTTFHILTLTWQYVGLFII